MKKSIFWLPLGMALATSAFFATTFQSCDQNDSQGPEKDQGTVDEAWNRQNDPMQMGQGYQTQPEALPSQGQLSLTPWTDTYWPSNQGGISARWNNPNPQPFGYEPPNQQQVAQMSLDQLKRLSPAEKYDIFMGRFDYPTVRSERQRTQPHNADWEGLCHGWAAAAYLYQEPKPVLLRNGYGQEVPFGSSDIKALLTYYQGQVGQSTTQFLGSRCNLDLGRNPGGANTIECRDTNAGAFHVVLTNQIGLRKEPFIADVTRDLKVWNQPIYSYNTRVLNQRNGASAGAAQGTVKETTFRTNITYTVEVPPNWNALNGTPGFRSFTETYEYRVEINAQNQIVGGEWLTANRPDFLWKQSKANLSGYWANVQQIYNSSVGGSNPLPTPLPTQIPTALPTYFPSPAPTFGPVPTFGPNPTQGPAPTPTKVPWPVPTFKPDPKPVPFPTPYQKGSWNSQTQAVLEKDGMLSCQWPYPRRHYLGKLGQQTCMNDKGQITAPVTKQMKQACQKQGVQNCQADQWYVEVYEYFYQQDEDKSKPLPDQHCPQGAQYDAEMQRCVDKSDDSKVLGPFFRDQIESCHQKSQGQDCTQQKWPLPVYQQNQKPQQL